MSNCTSCSAPLPGASNLCPYCGTRNDTDLHGIHKYTVVKPESERTCPQCEIPLRTVDLKIEGKFYIERCQQCMGIFFDPGELEALLEKSVTNVFTIDYKRLESITRELYNKNSQIKYQKCPVCRQMMRRTNFGNRSGVIVDRCREHGVWLDGGELKKIMEWKKAGGQLLDNKRKLEQQKAATTKTRRSAGARSYSTASTTVKKYYYSSHYDDNEDVLVSVFNIVGKLFG